MVRSTTEPELVFLDKIEFSEGSQVLSLRMRWNVHEIEVEDKEGTHQEYEYDEQVIKHKLPAYIKSIAEIRNYIEVAKEELLEEAQVQNVHAAIPTDAVTVRNAELIAWEKNDAVIDGGVGHKINKRIHVVAPIEEQIAIMRQQLIAIIMEGGYTPIPKFSNLNAIAIEEVAAGQSKKGV